jgi:hypothetical protein
MHNKVTIDQLRTIIPTIGVELTPIIQSEPGCGKTSLLGMIEEDLGDSYDYIYVDCPVKDMQDIAMTIPNHDNKQLMSYTGSLFKLDSPKPKVVLLDEFMKAPKMLQVIFTRLMLERCIGDTPLPKGSIVFGTSNNQSDGVGDTMLAHAGNRVCILEMEKPSVNSWLAWAGNSGIEPLVRAFVHMFPSTMHSYRTEDNIDDNPYVFNPKKPQLSFCSPRSLAKSSIIVSNRDRLGEEATLSALSGTIGASASGQMSAFLSLEKSLPDYDDIIKNPTQTSIPEQISAQLMVMFQATDKLDDQSELTKFMTYIKRMESDEMQALFFTMVMKNERTRKIARNNPEISAWAVDNHDLF